MPLHLLVTWTAEFGRVAILLFLLVFPGWFLLDAARSRVPRELRHPAVLFAIPASIIVICLLTVLLHVVHAPSDVFFLVAGLLYGVPLAVVLGEPSRRRRAWGDLREARFVLLLTSLVAVCAICYAGVGLRSFDHLQDWTRLALRNVHDLPGDNWLGWLGSATWRSHLAANALFPYPWRIGDRGPLYSLLHLFFSRVIELDAPSYANYTRLGIVLNSLFLGPLFLWFTELLERRTAWLCTALVGLNPWFFLNIYYTWPKLFSAFFLMLAVWLLWRRSAPKTSGLFVAAGALAGLAALAHAGSLFSLPVFLPVTLAVFTRPWRSTWRVLLIPAVLFLVLEPWQLYKRRYSPESYTLFYMHYLDDQGYFTPLSENVARFIREHPGAEQLAVRTAHVRDLWWGVLEQPLIAGFWTGADVGARLYVREFFAPWYSAGVVWFAWVVIALPVSILVRRFRRLRPGLSRRLARPLEWLATTRERNRDVPVWPVVAFVAGSLTLNEFIRWRPPYSHELPYLELVLLAALILVGLARLGRIWLIVPLVGVVARQAFYFSESSRVSKLGLPPIDDFGRLFWLTLIVILLMTLLPALGRQAPTENRL